MSTATPKPPDTIHDAAHATAEWWAGHLFAGLPGRNAGLDATPGAALLLMLEQVTAAEQQGGDDQRAKFVDVATRDIEQRVRRAVGMSYPVVTMSTDYGPSGEWREVIAESGVSAQLFPWKSCSWTAPDHVTASGGYQAKVRLVWSAPGWERPACGSEEYVDDSAERFGYRKTDRVCVLPRWHDEDAHHYEVAVVNS